jgi:hypothetical protein
MDRSKIYRGNENAESYVGMTALRAIGVLQSYRGMIALRGMTALNRYGGMTALRASDIRSMI